MKRPLILGLIALFAALSSATAGEVYVPFASNQSVNGTLYRTKVWVTNPTVTSRSFTTTFIEQGANGTTQAGSPTSLSLPAGGTILLGTVAPDGKTGVLEVNGAPQLVVEARVEAITGASAIVASADVPVVSTANVMAAGATANLLGLERTARGTTTDFALVNLSREAAQCTVKAYRANNSQIAQTAILALAPLSLRAIPEAFAILGVSSISDARFAVSCDKQFFTLARVYRQGGPDLVFVTPSPTLTGDLVPGSTTGGGSGGSGGGTPGPSPGSVVFRSPGTFLNATQALSEADFEMPLPAGSSYKRAVIDFDLFADRFPPGLFTSLMALRRNDRTLFYGLLVRGDRQKTILDMGKTDDVVTGSNGGPWSERTNYHVSVVYDTQAGTLVFRLSRGGAVVETLSGRINHFDLRPNDRTIVLNFGQTGIADGAYFPPLGWQFSNLVATFEP
jgi:hypothetical protein